ncbi:MAG: hypothetical protein AAB588_05315 [Patescibacteria group bacterium]
MREEPDLTEKAAELSARAHELVEKGALQPDKLASFLRLAEKPYDACFHTGSTSNPIDGYSTYESVGGVTVSLRSYQDKLPPLHPGDLAVITIGTIRFKPGQGVKIVRLHGSPLDSQDGRIVQVA